MSNPELGHLRPVAPRTLWPDEAADFTPWLARPDNIQALGTALGIEFEVQHTEMAAGPFSADILARDTVTGEYVVIENQLNRTDHDHLGKAITYAAYLGARTIVWVAPSFVGEHRKALDWMNDNTTEELSFFGVQVELWAIDNSRPAVRFNVVSRPTDLVRRATLAASAELTPVRKLQLEWWTAYRDLLVASNAIPSVQNPRARYWYDIALGRSGFVLSQTAAVDARRIGIRVYMSGRAGGRGALAQLLESREEIEREFGESLLWDPNPEADDKVISVQREADLRDRQRWPEYLDWMLSRAIRMRNVFAPRIRDLDLSTVAPAELDIEPIES